MLQLLTPVIVSFIERELISLEPSVQQFALKELKLFSDSLFKYVNDKMGTKGENDGQG